MKNILLFLILFSLEHISVYSAFSQTQNSNLGNEISVSADVVYLNSYDNATITMLLDHTAQSSTEASKGIEDKTTKLVQALKLLTPEVKTFVSGDKYSDSTNTTTQIKPGMAVKIERTVAVSTGDLSKVPLIIDRCFPIGVSAVLDIAYSIRNNTDANLEAIRIATKKATEKAQKVAESIGVKLGRVLSASITEEPENISTKLRSQFPIETLSTIELQMRVFVNLRFETIY